MNTHGRWLAVSSLLIGVCTIVVLTFSTTFPTPTALAQDDKVDSRDNQTYVGTKKCAACHFDQWMVWRKDSHSKAFDILPAKYKQDAACLKCHATGHGTPTGYKDASTAALAGVSCEACHGPGSNHADVAQKFASKKKLSKEEESQVRGTTHRLPPNNGCVTCHSSKGHKEHPKYDKG